MVSMRNGGTRFPCHQKINWGEIAACTWHTVSSGFPPPLFLVDFRQKQIADTAEDQMPDETLPRPAFVVVQADLLFAVLEAPLHLPPRKGHRQDDLCGSLRRRVGHEILDLAVERIAADQQVQRGSRQALFVCRREHHVLGFPDDRPLLAIFDVVGNPRLLAQHRAVLQMMGHAAGRKASRFQTRCAARPAASRLAVGAVGRFRQRDPAGERGGNFADEPLVAVRQPPQESRLAALSFVERNPFQVYAVGNGTVVKLQGNLPLGPVDDVVGNPRFLAARAVVRPVLGQEEIAVEQTVKVRRGVGQMDGDDAILDFAFRAAPGTAGSSRRGIFWPIVFHETEPPCPSLRPRRPLDARRFAAVFVVAGFVDHADCVRMGVIAADDVRHTVAHRLVVPREHTQKILQRPRRQALRQRDWLDAFALQARQLAVDVGRQMHSCIFPREAIGKLTQELVQTGFEPSNHFGIHATLSLSGLRNHRLSPRKQGSIVDFRRSGKTNLAL